MNTERFGVSAIVATYRREQTLVETLSDLLAQEDVEMEVIVIDQTPTHESATEEFLRRNAARLVYVQTPEANLPKARNAGVSRARGRVVFFVDDDVRVPRETVGRVLRHFESPDVDGVAPLVVDRSIEPPGEDVRLRYGFKGEWRTQERLRVNSVIGACMAFRRAAVLDVGGFDAWLGELNRSACGEDDEFCRRFTRAGYKLWLAPTIEVLHQLLTNGGCEARTHAKRQAMEMQVRALTYMILKEERAFKHLTARAAVRLLRASVVRRDVLSSGLQEVPRAVRNMVRTVGEVRKFLRQRCCEVGGCCDRGGERPATATGGNG